MSWLARLGFFVSGLFLILVARTQLQVGHAVFDNASYHQTTFAAGGIGVGIVILLVVETANNFANCPTIL